MEEAIENVIINTGFESSDEESEDCIRDRAVDSEFHEEDGSSTDTAEEGHEAYSSTDSADEGPM